MVPSGQGAGIMREHESWGSYCCFDSSCCRDVSCKKLASDVSGPNRRPKDRAHSRRERSARLWSADRRERSERDQIEARWRVFQFFGARQKWATGRDIAICTRRIDNSSKSARRTKSIAISMIEKDKRAVWAVREDWRWE